MEREKEREKRKTKKTSASYDFFFLYSYRRMISPLDWSIDRIDDFIQSLTRAFLSDWKRDGVKEDDEEEKKNEAKNINEYH